MPGTQRTLSKICWGKLRGEGKRGKGFCPSRLTRHTGSGPDSVTSGSLSREVTWRPLRSLSSAWRCVTPWFLHPLNTLYWTGLSLSNSSQWNLSYRLKAFPRCGRSCQCQSLLPLCPCTSDTQVLSGLLVYFGVYCSRLPFTVDTCHPRLTPAIHKDSEWLPPLCISLAGHTRETFIQHSPTHCSHGAQFQALRTQQFAE